MIPPKKVIQIVRLMPLIEQQAEPRMVDVSRWMNPKAE